MVVLITGIMATVAAPKLAVALQQFRVMNAAKRIAADLNRAQLAAYNSSLTKTVNFDFTQNQLAIPAFTTLNGGSGTYVLKLNADPFSSTFVSVWGQSSNQSLTFNGYGVPNQGGLIVIASGSVQKTIQVDASTGKAVIQ